MTDITILASTLDAGAKALAEVRMPNYTWDDLDSEMQAYLRADAYTCFNAMIEAWEGAKTIRDDGRRQTYAIPAIILPLPQEASDGKTLVDTISDKVWRHDSSGDNCCATDPQEASDDR